jgi:hypothetical protein
VNYGLPAGTDDDGAFDFAVGVANSLSDTVVLIGERTRTIVMNDPIVAINAML